MDERGKRADQKPFEAHIFICTHFTHLYSSRGFFDVAHSGGDPGPKENTPNIPRAINGSFGEMDL
jgi:hypothetical protein